MKQPTQSVEEMAKDFVQYMSDGYGGGKEGLRCDDCDRKYAGTSSLIQLCPECRAIKALTLTAEREREEGEQSIKNELKRLFERADKDELLADEFVRAVRLLAESKF